jgi:regulatory protein
MEDAKLIARAKNNAFALLRIRPRSEKELSRRLKEKGYGEEVVNLVVADLKKRGLIDDKKFARFWVESRMHLNPVGGVILKHELMEKGLSGDVIEAALSAKDAEYDEYALAKNMAVERFQRLRDLDRRKATKRVYDFLLRRGFKYDIIRRIIEDIVKLPLRDDE